MSFPTKHMHIPPFSTELPAPLVFRTACMPADAAYPRHSHPWGEFVYSFSGVMEVKVGSRQYLTPSQYGLWLPPNVEHQGLNRYETCHCSLYVDESLCHRMPQHTCALEISPLVIALLEHLRQTPITPPYRDEEFRLLQVLVEQLTHATPIGSYLPTSTDPLLGKVLTWLEQDPASNASLQTLAKQAHTTERTLMRRAQRDLGISVSEWRQRLRVVKAMPMLEAGDKVENIAHDLGYASASAFIAMFRRLMGVTPDEYRRNLGA
ncbi:AraC family transcriptional regulator [Vibrio fluvialis]|uniref:AraC family transcriptional regulator n=1 Tax=Vibrio fluvialis TaxID=676 RepID=UPI0003F76BE2|nr:helix-turn-helix transcriptional regulator [Vibrio fluvialis]EKO3910743.1 helix-turn-helix transcriptional regulator [Vibrio fluvialis]EKO3978532.1 helix-turn-helix transcriptional regulator [Vibrio fluvialis]ELI5738256.1 helix-turn-helix transcriptional regulator [Vibrio fluvialis]ELS8948490.1 helix-turn-helix transcriptional regulator [Vibrio fluvialis]ELV8594017.1 helix-turn-helix transcriptional regulator [Vibrio fluvialis]